MANKLTVVIWDVQHGSAVFVRTPTGKTLAIDLGVGSFKYPEDATFSPLLHLRSNWGVTALDQLIITHPHKDHLDDIANLAYVTPRVLMAPRQIPIDLIRTGNNGKDQTVIDAYLDLLTRYSSPVPATQALNNESTWGCVIKTFFPPYIGSNLNNYSAVTTISFAGSTILIPGDNEPASWKLLLDHPGFVSAIRDTNVFITSHHGRESGYCADLFDHFKPRICIVSDTNDIPTSATNKYSYQATGCNVLSRSSGTREQRMTVTTRSDDYVVVTCWPELVGNGIQNYFDVSIN